MDDIEAIVNSVCAMIQSIIPKCKSVRDVSALTDLMRSRMILSEYMEKHGDDMEKSPEEAWDVNRVEAEIKAAETYFHKWQETGDEKWKEIAETELEHATMILTDSETITPQQSALLKKKIHALTIELKK